MLSENSIDKLILPLLNRQSQIEGVVISAIAERLNQIKTMTPSDIYKLERLLKTGSDAKKINKQIAVLSKMSEKDIKKIIKTVAADAYKDVKPFYDYRKLSYIPFEENIELQNTVKAIERATLAEYTRLSNSTAFMLRDISNPLILHATPLSNTYNTIIDSAIQSVVSGLDSYNQVIPNTIKQLIASGVKTVEYTTKEGKKHYTRLDTVVRRNILDGIRNIQQEVQNITGEQFGADGVEISVHQYSAPDHEPIQGHQLTKDEYEKMQLGENFEDVNGQQFTGFDRPIGVWNCRHIAWNIIIGHKTPNYTLEELENLKQKNANGITIKNRKGENEIRSMYWCTQKRNDYELKLRQLKEGQAMAEKCGQDDVATTYRNKVTSIQNQYISFCKSCGLKTRFENTRIFV